MKKIFSILIIVVLSIFVGLPVFLAGVSFFIAQPIQVKGASMAPTYTDGQFYFINKFIYRFKNPERGDTVYFRSPSNANIFYIKRIIAIPEDKITLKQNQLYVNNVIVQNLMQTSVIGGSFLKDSQEIVIPEGEYFLMSNNPDHGFDSREWGLILRSNIVGKVAWCYYGCKE